MDDRERQKETEEINRDIDRQIETVQLTARDRKTYRGPKRQRYRDRQNLERQRLAKWTEMSK